MVRAILEDSKTVTRRVVKTQHKDACGFFVVTRKSDGAFMGVYDYDENERMFESSQTPPACVGGVLYVRESWLKTKREEIYKYRADCYDAEARLCKWHPSIHMPKVAARIFLRVKDVKVQHVHDMRLADFLAEGVMLTREELQDQDTALYKARQQFKEIWNSTVGKPGTKEYQMYNWDANPLVWVIEFERIEKVDAVEEVM